MFHPQAFARILIGTPLIDLPDICTLNRQANDQCRSSSVMAELSRLLGSRITSIDDLFRYRIVERIDESIKLNPYIKGSYSFNEQLQDALIVFAKRVLRLEREARREGGSMYRWLGDDDSYHAYTKHGAVFMFMLAEPVILKDHYHDHFDDYGYVEPLDESGDDDESQPVDELESEDEPSEEIVPPIEEIVNWLKEFSDGFELRRVELTNNIFSV